MKYDACYQRSKQLRVAVIKTIDMIVQVMNKNNATESIYILNHISFYKDGSLLVNCGMKQHNPTIFISTAQPDPNYVSQTSFFVLHLI